MKILSITVPCYNSQEYMKKCIDSLLAGGGDVEILIVDDGSTDDKVQSPIPVPENTQILSGQSIRKMGDMGRQ